MLELILQTCANAVVSSSFIALFAVGLVLAFGVMKVVNFAQGELYMAGAYTVFFLYAQKNLPFFLAVIGAVLLVVAIGLFMELAFFRPLRGNMLGGMILSIGMLFILQVAAVHFFGEGLMKNVIAPLKGSWAVFGLAGVSVPYQRLLVFAITGGLLLLFWLFLTRTKLGWALRACSQNPEVAALQGMNMNALALIAMAISAAFAGVAGAVMAPLVVVNPHMGGSVIITAFVVIIVGGMGSLTGAVIAAVLYSFFDTFVTTFYDGVTASILGLAIMLLVLVFRPTGILGTAEADSGSGGHTAPEVRVKQPNLFWGKGLGLAALLGLLCSLPFIVRPFQLEILIFLFLNIVVVVSYRLIVVTGEWSFGHVVTMGVGAYASALLTTRLGLSPWLGMPLGGATAALLAYILSFPLFRMKAFFFLIGTFAAAEAIRLSWLRFRKFFGGADGITGIPSLEIGDLNLGLPVPSYYFVLLVGLLSLLVMYRLEKSRFGLILNAIHWRDTLAESIGVNARRYRTMAFVVASFFAGIAGTFYAHYIGLVSPHAFDLELMLKVMVWAIVGGTTTFVGPIIGATLLTFTDELIRGAQEYRPLIYGAILIVTMLFLPQGLESLPAKTRYLFQRLRGTRRRDRQFPVESKERDRLNLECPAPAEMHDRISKRPGTPQWP